MSQWTNILTIADLKARYELTSNLDARFARDENYFWSTRTIDQLHILQHQAWLTNSADQWQLARSYLALK